MYLFAMSGSIGVPDPDVVGSLRMLNGAGGALGLVLC